ncbi:MAG: hypothetical protein U9Q22_03595 [Candidatus Altiarchaeota archaeon]|nr:hypothetical protein [Candidatus Altiarchaeota archaeon]
MSKEIKVELILLCIILISCIGVRVEPLKYTYPLGMDAYSHAVNARHILETGLPLTYDPLSWQGKPVIYPPIFPYSMALFMFLLPDLFAISMVGVFFGVLGLCVFYVICRTEVGKKSALLALILVGFSSAHIIKTSTNALADSMSPLFLLAYLYFFGKSRSKALVVALIYPLVHASSILIIPITGVYLILKYVGKEKILGGEIHTFILASIMVLGLSAGVYYPLIMGGISLNWIPEGIRHIAIEDIGFHEFLYRLGYLPFILFMPGFLSKKRNLFFDSLFICMAASILFGFMETDRALYYLIFPLGFYSAVAFNLWIKNERRFYVIFILLLLVQGVIGYNSIHRLDWGIITHEQYQGFLALKETPEDSTILARIDNGHRIEFFAHRKNFINGNLELAPNPEQRLRDYKKMICGDLNLLSKYHIDYIYLGGEEVYQLRKKGCRLDFTVFYQNREIIILKVF